MASVIGHRNETIKLRDCDCGGEPKYVSSLGLAHIVRCTVCAATTDLERSGYDAVSAWNNNRLKN